MLTVVVIATISAVLLLVAPALCLQLHLRRCWQGTTAPVADTRGATQPETEAAPLSQRLAMLARSEVAPVSRVQPLSA